MFTNRFYYSEQQKCVMQSIGQDGKNFIVLSTGKEVEYTEWCSSPESKCNWEDARLVYASDTEPQFRHEWGEQEKEEWDLLCKEAFETYEEADWDTPLDGDDDLTSDMDENISEKYLRELPKIEEPYLRGKDFNQDT